MTQPNGTGRVGAIVALALSCRYREPCRLLPDCGSTWRIPACPRTVRRVDLVHPRVSILTVWLAMSSVQAEAEFKFYLRDLAFSSAREVEVTTNKKAIIITVSAAPDLVA